MATTSAACGSGGQPGSWVISNGGNLGIAPLKAMVPETVPTVFLSTGTGAAAWEESEAAEAAGPAEGAAGFSVAFSGLEQPPSNTSDSKDMTGRPRYLIML